MNAPYTVDMNGVITRTSDSAIIPVDICNFDYQDYLTWVQNFQAVTAPTNTTLDFIPNGNGQ